MERMTRKCSRLLLPAVLIFLAGCASSQQSNGKSNPPDWVMGAPKESSTAAFFIGSAVDENGSMSKAEEAATYAVISEITRFLGVRVTEETTATAKASLDSFTAELTQVIRQNSSTQMSGFRIADKWVSKQDKRVTVYLLGEYNKKDLLAEKERLAAVFREKQAAVSGPEEEAGRLEMKKDYFGAIKKYCEAAGAAYKSDIDNAKIKFERNLNNVRRILSKLTILPVKDNIENFTGMPFSESLQAVILYGDERIPVTGALFEISYRENTSGRTTVRNVSALSNVQGIVVFQPPVPAFVGTEKVTMRLDLSSYLEPLSGVPSGMKAQVDALDDLALSKKIVLSYSSVSRAKGIATGVVILDVDKAQNPMKNGETSAGVLQSLSGAGFTVSALSLDPALLKGMSDSQIIEMVRKSNPAGIERLVFGVIGIEDFSQEGDNFLVRVAGTLKAVDLASGNILYSKQEFTRTVGRNSSGTISSAFRNLGKRIGDELAAKLQ